MGVANDCREHGVIATLETPQCQNRQIHKSKGVRATIFGCTFFFFVPALHRSMILESTMDR